MSNQEDGHKNGDKPKSHGRCGCHICRHWIIQYMRMAIGTSIMLVIDVGRN